LVVGVVRTSAFHNLSCTGLLSGSVSEPKVTPLAL
jgi:hypothetical protein